MEPSLVILWLISVFVVFLIYFQLRKIYQKYRAMAVTDTAREIKVIRFDKDDVKAENELTEQEFYRILDRELAGTLVDDKAERTAFASQEKRRHKRRKIRRAVEFIKKGMLYKATSRDLSYSGMFIEVKDLRRYRFDDFLILTFQIAKDKHQKHKGRVARISKEGLGIEFI